jgi:uncharacterized protein
MKAMSVCRAALGTALLIAVALSQGCARVSTPVAQAPAATGPARPAPETALPATLPPPTATPAAAPTASATASTTAASPVGQWKGQMEFSGQQVPVEMKLSGEGSALKGTVSFPQSGAIDATLDKLSHQNGKLHMEVGPAPGNLVFEGEVRGDNISGTFAQPGLEGTFALERMQVVAVATETLPYKADEVTFRNGDATLAGTLTLPEGSGPFPAVALVSGSGAENRDEEILGFKIFRIVADHLTRNGIAVLRYDDRGIGGSSQVSHDDTSETYAGDAAAAVQFLKGRPEINPKQIGLLGHSEGGIIAPMVASQTSDVAFIILMAGTGEPGSKILVDQARTVLEARGASAADVEKAVTLERQIVDAALRGEGWGEARQQLIAEVKAGAAQLPENQRKALGDIDQWAEKTADAQLRVFEGAWMQFFLKHDPAPVLEKVQVPVLALFGGKDVQVPAESNRAAVEQALDKGGNKDHTEKVFPEANHLFQAANTGGIEEYATLKQEFVPGFLDTISEWILGRTQG